VDVAKSQGAKRAVLLPVSVPSHCALMTTAAEELSLLLRETNVQTPKIPVINNVDVAAAEEPDAIRDALRRQLFRPVRWVEIIQYMADSGAERIVECGPGKVLVGLNKRINRGLNAVALHDGASLREALAS
jgi:[acyl-carrier-protein] S-malonyltransferase